MAKRLQEIQTRLQALVREIEAIYAILDIDTPDFPAEARKRLDQRICLECGKKLGKDDAVKRGCHEKCFRRQDRAIKRGDFTEAEAIAKGKLAPPSRGGRKPIPTSLQLESEADKP